MIQNQNMSMNTRKEATTFVKIVGVLYYISAGIALLIGILAIAGAGLLASLFGGLGGGFLGGLLGFVIAIPLILFAVLFFFVARGLFKLKKWARVVAVIFGIIGLLSAIGSFVSGGLTSGFANLIIEGFIVYTLLIDKASRQAFA